MKNPFEKWFVLENFAPSLQAALSEQPLDFKKIIRAALVVQESDGRQMQMPERIEHRNLIGVTDGTNLCDWEVESLQSLFRGDRQPPVLGDYPEAYQETFMLLDLHVLEISNVFGDRRDEEMLEIYTALRKRPDGRSLGYVHDYMWQAAALALGTRPLSRMEFEAIIARLERSCRTFSQGATSRNYAASLHLITGQGR